MIVNETLSKLPDDMLKKGFLKNILEAEVDISDDIYKKSFKDTYKVNYHIFGEKGYQLFEPTNYKYKMGEALEDPDLTLIFRDLNYIREILRGERIDSEWGRDSKNVQHMNRRDLMIKTHMRTDERNAQVLLAKLPIFKQALENFGTSRLTRYLRDEPEYISPVKEGEIESLMKKMLDKSVDNYDDTYQKNFQNQVLKVNWDVNGILSYQIFEETDYHYEFGKNLADADITLTIENPDHAKRFLLNLPTNYAPGLGEDNNLFIYIKLPIISAEFKDPSTSRYSLLKLPFFRALLRGAAPTPADEKKEDDLRENYGHYIPVNLPIGEFEKMVVPYKVLEHFINKASNIVLRTCPCRERYECQDYSIKYGCIFMGDDTKNMALSPDEGYVATKEQALEHVRNALDEGLVAGLGRNVGEAEGGHGVVDTGRFLSGCFCCDCCCIGVKTREYGIPLGMYGDANGQSMEGWRINVDYDKCVGCGECTNACPFHFRKVVNGKISVDSDQCIGCGRCVKICPNNAISFDIEDPDYIEKYIAKIESIVDVEDQTIKS